MRLLGSLLQWLSLRWLFLRWLSLLWPIALAIAALAIMPAQSARATPIYYLGPDANGSLALVDAASPASWSFTATSNWTFGGAYLSLAALPATSAALTLSLYQGQDASGLLLGTTTLSNRVFCEARGPGCSGFGTTPLILPQAFALTTGTNYFVSLTTSATQWNKAYFINGLGATTIVDGSGATLPAQPMGTVTTTAAAVPEPFMPAVLGVALIGLGLARRYVGRRQ